VGRQKWDSQFKTEWDILDGRRVLSFLMCSIKERPVDISSTKTRAQSMKVPTFVPIPYSFSAERS
jgi:hypothetical protein